MKNSTLKAPAVVLGSGSLYLGNVISTLLLFILKALLLYAAVSIGGGPMGMVIISIGETLWSLGCNVLASRAAEP